MQKGQLTQWTWHIWVVVTITFSTKRSNPTQYAVGIQYAVGVSAERSTHRVDLAIMGGGDRYL